MSDAGTEDRVRYGAGIGASLIAEMAFIISTMSVFAVMGREVWAVVRMAGVLVVGPEVMQPTGWVPEDILLGGAMHAGMAVLVGTLYAMLLPRTGVSAVAGGLITAAVLYTLGFLVLPAIFPAWLAPFRVSPVIHLVEIAMHGVYGLVFGWSYGRMARRSATGHRPRGTGRR